MGEPGQHYSAGSVAIAEPLEAAFVSDRVPLIAGLSAIALENIFLQLIGGAVYFIRHGRACWLSLSLPKPLRYASFGGADSRRGYRAARLSWSSGDSGISEWADGIAAAAAALPGAGWKKTIPRAQRLKIVSMVFIHAIAAGCC